MHTQRYFLAALVWQRETENVAEEEENRGYNPIYAIIENFAA